MTITDIACLTWIAGFLLWGASMALRLSKLGKWCLYHNKWVFRGHLCTGANIRLATNRWMKP